MEQMRTDDGIEQPLSALDDVMSSAEQRVLLEADAKILRALGRHQTYWLDHFSGQTDTAGETPERTRSVLFHGSCA